MEVPSEAMTDLADLRPILRSEFDALAARVAQLETPAPPGTEPTVSDDDIEACWRFLCLQTRAVHERSLNRTFGRAVVDATIDHNLARRTAGRRVVPHGTLDSTLAAIAEVIEATWPDGAKCVLASDLRDRFNKNTLARIIDDGVRSGVLRRGTVQMGRAGRPRTVIALSHKPQPTHFDAWKVNWR